MCRKGLNTSLNASTRKKIRLEYFLNVVKDSEILVRYVTFVLWNQSIFGLWVDFKIYVSILFIYYETKTNFLKFLWLKK